MTNCVISSNLNISSIYRWFSIEKVQNTFSIERLTQFYNFVGEGFKEVTACCGSGTYGGLSSCGGKRAIKEYELCDNPNEYLFFDSAHSSEKAYKQIAELMWNGTPDVTGPYNLKMLFEHSTFI